MYAEKIGFYKTKYGYGIYGEMFVTNKYGANVGQTQKTSDYYQADEEWWQKAEQNGLYVGNVDYDRSAGVYSIDICGRINDDAGDFAGVLKAVLNIEEVIRIVREFEEAQPQETARFELVTKEGRIIYSTDKYEFFELCLF